jgi:hypothetical protein
LLNFFYSTNQGIDNAIPVLLVDGYNVCGYWMKLKKHFVNGRLDIARQKLIDELVTFSLLRGSYSGSSISCIRWLINRGGTTYMLGVDFKF